jgi:hypothetical protein
MLSGGRIKNNAAPQNNSSKEKPMPTRKPRFLLNIQILCLALLFAISSCTPFFPVETLSDDDPVPTPQPESLISFRVRLQEQLSPGDSIYLTILDEVTGLALNPTHYILEAEDSVTYSVILPFRLQSTLKYRYTRAGDRVVQEHFSDGSAVRYRILKIDGPTVVNDVISRWTDTSYSGPVGRVHGQVTNGETGSPAANILIAIGGAHTFSAYDGTFSLDGLPPGIHNLAAYSIDGSFKVYQQGASIAADSATPAQIKLTPSRFVKVDFIVSIPDLPLPSYQVKLAGNLFQTGNTFADLKGGVSMLPSRMPPLVPLDDGRFFIRLELPTGADFRYKYTLGDGFWNSEHKENGRFQIRQLIVPDHDLVIEEQVHGWGYSDFEPATFEVSVPENTPANDYLSIQFNPGHGWTEPIPMWKVDSYRWSYILYPPIESLGQVQYRFCRSDQCGSADDRFSPGIHAAGHVANISQAGEAVNMPVKGWVWFESQGESVIIPDIQVRPRGEGFMAGVEFQPEHHPSWGVQMDAAMADIASMNANYIILSPTWTYTGSNQPHIQPVPGTDPLLPEVMEIFRQAEAASLNIGIFPAPRFPIPLDEWWKASPRDFPFWVTWFNSYHSFILNFASLAEDQSGGPLILGGEWVQPALPEGKLFDGSPSNVPQDAETRWRDLIGSVREHYHGILLWAIPFPEGLENPPPFLDEFDGLYLLWSAPLAAEAADSEYELAQKAGQLLDELVAPLQEALEIPVILGLAYPSVEGWLDGCLRLSNGFCARPEILARPNPDIPELKLSLHEQVRAYNALFMAANERDWIGGMVSRGYYPPAVLHDKSASIHGKPARAVLWYWFPHMLGADQ